MLPNQSKCRRTFAPLLALAALCVVGVLLTENAPRLSLQPKVFAQASSAAVGTPAPTPAPTPRPIVTPPSLSPYTRRTPAPAPAATPRTSRYLNSRKGKETPSPEGAPGAGRSRLVPATPPGVQPGQKVQRFTQAAPSQAGKAGRGTETPPTLQFRKDAIQTCLHFKPFDLQVKPGEEFEIALVLSNRSGRPVDALNLVIAYDPRWLTFLESAPTSSTQAAQPAKMSNLTPATGRLLFSSPFASPILEEDAELFRLKFKAANVAGLATLRFLTPPQGATAVLNGGENLLGNEEQQLRGVIQSYVFISNSPANELLPAAEGGQTTSTPGAPLESWAMPGDAQTTNPLQRAWLRTPPNARAEEGAYVSLQGPERSDIAAGETFWVDLVLHNDNLAPIESVGAKIVFDPNALAVVDEDKGNWIASGINAWDGAFHESYPFDFLRANTANNARGEILYQAGRQYGVWAFPTGVFARVKFRTKADAQGTAAIRLVRAAQGGRPQTYVRSFGIDRMEGFWEKQTPAPVRVRIRPASQVSLKNAARPGLPAAPANATKTPAAR